MKNNKSYEENIKIIYENLSSSEKKVADYILSDTHSVLIMTLNQLSSHIDVSDINIINFAKKMGFNGYTQFKMNLLEELV